MRTLNRSLQQKALNLGEENILDSTHTQPLSLLSEIQQSQVHTPIHTHIHTHHNCMAAKFNSCLCVLILTLVGDLNGLKGHKTTEVKPLAIKIIKDNHKK